MLCQDLFEEKCVISLDGKGDLKFADAVYGSFLIREDFRKRYSPERILGTSPQFLYFNPALPNLSASYNPVFTDRESDLGLLTERVFRAFGITHEHWGPVGLDMLRFLIRALYATGRQFNLSDIYICLKSTQ